MGRGWQCGCDLPFSDGQGCSTFFHELFGHADLLVWKASVCSVACLTVELLSISCCFCVLQVFIFCQVKFSRAVLFCGCLFTFSFAAQTLFNFLQSPLSILLLLPNYPCPIQKSSSASVSGSVSPVTSSSSFRFCLTLRSLIHLNWFLWSDGV